jgi:hypothetical protein
MLGFAAIVRFKNRHGPASVLDNAVERRLVTTSSIDDAAG